MSGDKKDASGADDKAVKIDKWDTSALKNALDDAAKKVILDEYGYKESHNLMDGRLGICTIAVGFAMFALIWDYLHPFPESRPILIICVMSYFILMGVLTLYTTYKEKGVFLVAHEKDRAGMDPDNIWVLSSNLKKYDDMYQLSAHVTDGKTGVTRLQEVSKSVANFFDKNGILCMDLYNPIVKKIKQHLDTSKKKN